MIFTGTVKQVGRETLATTYKRVFNTNRIGELKADSTDSVFFYTKNKAGDRYHSVEYKVDETKATIDAQWVGGDDAEIVLSALQKKVDGRLVTYAEDISIGIDKIGFGWADPDDATKSWIEVYPSPFKKVLYQVDVPIAYLNGVANVLSFNFLDAPNDALDADVTGVIDNDAGTIALLVPAATVVTALVATFSLSTGASATVSATPQVSGTTANNFTNPVVYVVTGANGVTKSFTITVTIDS